MLSKLIDVSFKVTEILNETTHEILLIPPGIKGDRATFFHAMETTIMPYDSISSRGTGLYNLDKEDGIIQTFKWSTDRHWNRVAALLEEIIRVPHPDSDYLVRITWY
jgi:hypothetical protein